MTSTALALPDDDSEAQARWADLLTRISKGEKLEDAMLECRVTLREMESTMLGSPLEGQRWRDARLQGTASKFSLLQRDDIFARLARGVPIETALVEVCGTDENAGMLFELIEALPDWSERYDAAMRALALREEQSLLEIVDNTSTDILDNGKGGQQGNTAAVLRSRLRWEARTWRLAKMDPKRFGEQSKTQVNIQINNHAEVLEAARTRDKVRDKGVTKEQMRDAVDATFRSAEMPAVEPAQAADAQKLSNADELHEQTAVRFEEKPGAAEPEESENPFSCLEE